MTGNLEVAEDSLVPIPAPRKKKKRSKRTKSKKGKNKPTGFEEYYVDAPITAEEHEFELDLYHISRPIAHRLENAILRFSKNRRIEPDRLEVFNKYLQYGCVDVSPKMFAGVDERGMKEMDKEDILLARGKTSINQGCSNLIIDFNAVVKGYLTSYFPFYFNPFTEEMIKLATVTIRSFLSYLLYHDVCPEYKENIDEARKSCDVATGELWKNQQLTAEGTDDFNKACSILFGGLEHELYIEDNKWKNPKDDTVHMTKKIAQKVVRFGLGVAGTDDIASTFHHKAITDTLTAKKLQDIHGFEVTGVRFLEDKARQFYQDQAPDLHPVGILFGRTYYDPAEPEYDLSPTEREEWVKNGLPVQDFMFFLEERLLEHCYPGMRIIASIWELNCGFHYFEEVIRAYCSIYTPLANELMMGWKKPRALATNKEQDDSDAE